MRSEGETRFYNNLRKIAPDIEVRINRRYDWLIGPHGGRLELDFYMPDIDVAVEIQGDQHFVYVPHMHGSMANYKLQLKRDEVKRLECTKRNIKLFQTRDVIDEDEALKYIREAWYRKKLEEEWFAEKVRRTRKKLKEWTRHANKATRKGRTPSGWGKRLGVLNAFRQLMEERGTLFLEVDPAMGQELVGLVREIALELENNEHLYVKSKE